MTPIRLGLVEGERRTYEERLRQRIGAIADRHARGLDTMLSAVPTIHFGRMMVIRPEQYLARSEVDGLAYGAPGVSPPTNPSSPEEGPARPRPQFRSWLLTLVEFDGDLKIYMRDVARNLNHDFDRIYENCEDYPGTANFDAFWPWIRRHQVSTNLFYAPYGGVSVARIKQLERFKKAFDAFLASRASGAGELEALLDDFLKANQQYARDEPPPLLQDGG